MGRERRAFEGGQNRRLADATGRTHGPAVGLGIGAALKASAGDAGPSFRAQAEQPAKESAPATMTRTTWMREIRFIGTPVM
jgi:hypothetical protein